MKTSVPSSASAPVQQQQGVASTNPLALLGAKPPVANPFSALAKSKTIPPALTFSDEEEKHSLFAGQENGEVKLMVASTPQLLENYIKSKKEAVKSTTNAAAFDSVMALVEIYNQVSSGFKNDLGKRLKFLMDSAVQEMSDVGTGDDNQHFAFIPPPTQVVWGGTKTDGVDTVGTSMQASHLSINPGGYTGSEPDSPYKSGGAGYVKGHLLNHHLHGAASNENLTPMRGKMNTAFEKNFESFLKQKVISENKVFRFEVEAKDFVGMGIVPLTVDVNAVELKHDGANWIDDPDGWSISGTVDQSGNVTRTVKEGADEVMDLMHTGNDPGLLTAFINHDDTPYSEKLMELETEYASIQYEWSSAFGSYLKGIMQQIVLELTTTFPDTAAFLPKTLVEYGPTKKFKNSENTENFHFKDEHGTSMHAKLLSINPGNNHGYEPEGKRWGKLVQGHLLNHHLHGPASSENLLPMSNSLNTQMEKDIESVAKTWVLEENKVVSYKVEAANDVKIDESEILLGKDFDVYSTVPQTPNNAITEYDTAWVDVAEILDNENINITDFKKRKFVADTDEDKTQKRFKAAEDTLYGKDKHNLALYEKLDDYYVPAGIKAELQPLKLKNDVDTSVEANVDNPDSWVNDGSPLTFTGINSLDEKAK